MARRPLAELLGAEITDCACGREHRIPTRAAALQPGAIQQLPDLAERHFQHGTLICVMDANTRLAAGETAAALLAARGRTVDVHRVDRHAQPAHADRETVERLIAAVRRTDAIGLVAVGSGTINDVCKSAATRVGCPLITVATAASMNGYPSAISALTVDGLKTTEPCAPPVAVIADPEILATAPPTMTGAGFGDLLSKNASTADWIVSRILFDDHYCRLSAAVAEDAVDRCIANAVAIRRHAPEGLAILAEALLRSGISMVIAGSSAPASGGEHLISHLWDMTAHWTGRTPALHGEQTGVTTLISLGLYERLLALDAAAIGRICGRAAAADDPAEFERRMQDLFRDIGDVIMPHARTKWLNGPNLAVRRERIAARWEDIRTAVAPVVIPAARSRDHLRAVGAVCTIAELGISREEARFALRHARFIRSRYTVLDLAADIGMLDAWEEDLLAFV